MHLIYECLIIIARILAFYRIISVKDAGVEQVNLDALPSWMVYFVVYFIRRHNLPYLSSDSINNQFYIAWPAFFGKLY